MRIDPLKLAKMQILYRDVELAAERLKLAKMSLSHAIEIELVSSNIDPATMQINMATGSFEPIGP